jgi:O-antigen/teichoic acid export membrane protein
MFDYGKDLFITSVGTQLIWASQTMIITRRLGLEMAAVWAVGTRAFGLVCQLTWRIMTFATPALSEMIVREEKAKLRERFKDIVVFSASFSGFSAVVFASCNSTFVHLLSHGKILWSSQNDLLLGVWMILLAMLGCHNNLVLARKEIYFLRYIYLMEGLAFVIAAWLVAPFGGLAGIILCSVLCSAVFSYAYGIRRSGGYFGNPVGEIAYVWVLPMFRVVVFFAPVILLTWFATQNLNDFGRLAILSLVSGTIGIAILLSQGLSLSLQEEIIRRVPSSSKSILRRCFRWNCARNETG